MILPTKSRLAAMYVVCVAVHTAWADSPAFYDYDRTIAQFLATPVETVRRVAPNIIMSPPMRATAPGRMLSHSRFADQCHASSNPIE